MNYQDEWRRVRDEGEGFDPERGRTLDEAVADYERGGAIVIQSAHTTDDIAILRTPDGRVIGVGDMDGPWACVLDEPLDGARDLGRTAGELDGRAARKDGAAPAAQFEPHTYREEALTAMRSWSIDDDRIVIVTNKQKDAFCDAYRRAMHDALDQSNQLAITSELEDP